MRFSDLVLSLLLYTTLSAAWPWPPTMENINNALMRRQDDDSSTQSDSESTSAEPSKTSAATTAKETAKASKTKSSDETETGTSASKTAKETGTKTGDSDSKKTTKTSKSSSISIDPAGSPGIVTMVEPPQTSKTYVKIGEDVTFKWNYTGLLVSPDYLDVIATNSAGNTWTITGNMSMEETGSVTWDTSKVTPALGMDQYGFIVYDAADGPSATVEAGHLAPMQNPYQFAMYSPRGAQGTGKSFCVTCSAAVTAAERQSLKVLMFVATLTVVSFTWFTCGFMGV